MRASRKGGNKTDIHISGAETICEESAIHAVSRNFIKRALEHTRGRPDEIVVTVEALSKKAVSAPLLPLYTSGSKSPAEAHEAAGELLLSLGISPRAIAAARRILSHNTQMRGAALLSASTGKRLDRAILRGIRVSRFGIDPTSEKLLRKRLSALKLNNSTVKEALILASKVASCRGVIAELCISDDPDYTTGYAASKKSGYLRLPNIKLAGDFSGGRVFFLSEDADISAVTEYLQRTAVMLAYK